MKMSSKTSQQPAPAPQVVNNPVSTYNPSRCGYIYSCVVEADGTFTLGPLGWTAERRSAGVYRITHNIGNTAYLPLVGELTAAGDFKSNVVVIDRQPAYLDVQGSDGTQAKDGRFTLCVLTL